jgi:hypothetical protein
MIEAHVRVEPPPLGIRPFLGASSSALSCRQGTHREANGAAAEHIIIKPTRRTRRTVEAVRRRALSLSAPCFQADFFAHLTDERRLGREGPEMRLRLQAAAQPVG